MAKKKQTESEAAAAIEPEVVAPSRVVTGRRVSPRREAFVPDDLSEETADEPEEVDDSEAIEIEPEPELSDVEILLQQAGNDELYTLRVDRLVSFESDGRTDSRADKAFCMYISPPSLDYLEKVAARFKGGTYQFSIYKKGYGIVKRWTEHIAEAVESAQPAVENTAPAAQVPFDPMGMLIKQANQIKQLRIALVGDMPQQPNQLPASTQPPPDPIELMRQTLGMYKEISDIAPRDTKGRFSWIGDVAELARAVGIGEIIKPVGQLLMQQIARQMQPQGGTPQAPNGAQPEPTQLEPPTAEQQLAILLLYIAEDLKRDKRPGRAAANIEDFLVQFPDYKEQVLGMLNEQPETIIVLLGTATNQPDLGSYSHAVQWIADLQDELRGDEVEGEGEAAQE